MTDQSLDNAILHKTKYLLIIAIVACAIIVGLIYYSSTQGNISISTQSACLKSVPENEIRPCLDSLYTGSTYMVRRDKFKSENITINTPKIAWSGNSIFDTLLWFLAAISGLALCIAIYFAPSIVAQSRGCKSLAGITILNLFLGWTLIGWVASLIWAVTSVASENVTNHNHNQSYSIAVSEIEQLTKLHKSGHLTEEEYAAAKRRFLGL